MFYSNPFLSAITSPSRLEKINNNSFRVLDQLIPDWILNIALHMDNAATNKNRFVVYMLAALVKAGRLHSVDLSFMVVGHTKVFSATLDTHPLTLLSVCT